MLEGGLPPPGSISVPKRPRSLRRIAVVTAMGVLFTGGFGGMAVASFSASDPVAHANTEAAAPLAEAPLAPAPTPAAVAENAPVAVASVSKVTGPAAKKKPKKPAAKKKRAKRSKKSRSKQVASRR